MINDEQTLNGKISGEKKLVGNISKDSPKVNGQLNNAIVETGNYNNLYNKPSINDIELVGNVTLEALDIQPAMESMTNTEIEDLIGD